MALPNNIFTGYNPNELRTLAQRYGYNEANLDNFGKFLEENPESGPQGLNVDSEYAISVTKK